MSKDKILVVDDEEINLAIIAEFLSRENLDLVLEADALLAWQLLDNPENHYALVVLDRIMPNLDGINFLNRMKANPKFFDIPVIMQTAASSPEQVKEGLEAGAYYYLTKPYEREALVSIVRGALDDFHSRRHLKHLSKRLEDTQALLVMAEYRFSNLRDIYNLVPVIAGYSPKPIMTAAGLSDLMVNAVEHGNLGITYQEKIKLKLAGKWEQEIERRLRLPEYSDRFASIKAERHSDRVDFTIADKGSGFEWQQYLEFDPKRVFDPTGRGIALARKMSFSNLEFIGKGNVVVASVHF